MTRAGGGGHTTPPSAGVPPSSAVLATSADKGHHHHQHHGGGHHGTYHHHHTSTNNAHHHRSHHCRWDVVLASVISLLAGMALMQHSSLTSTRAPPQYGHHHHVEDVVVVVPPRATTTATTTATTSGFNHAVSSSSSSTQSEASNHAVSSSSSSDESEAPPSEPRPRPPPRKTTRRPVASVSEYPKPDADDDDEAVVAARGAPTAVDPSGRSGLAALADHPNPSSSSPRLELDVGAWTRAPAPKPATRGVLQSIDPLADFKPDSSVPLEFCESSAARLDELVIIAGGFLCDFNRVTRAVQLLNRTSGLWTTRFATLPETAAATHQGAAASWSPSHPGTLWVYLVSGQIGPGCTVGTTEAWALQVRRKKTAWHRMPDLPEVRYAPSAYVHDNHLHVIGGAGPNRRDPRPEHWALPLAPSGKPLVTPGWFLVDALPDGGADSCGAAVAMGHVFRVGGQHGHPAAVNKLVDNNKQCQDSPEVARVGVYRRPLSAASESSSSLSQESSDDKESSSRWRMVAPLPWPASHVGLSTVATRDEQHLLVVSGKEGKATTDRVATYDVLADRWRVLENATLPLGQPDYLVWFEHPDERRVHALKFKWHPTNSTLNDDYVSITKAALNSAKAKSVAWPNAFVHLSAEVSRRRQALPPAELEEDVEEEEIGLFLTQKEHNDAGAVVSYETADETNAATPSPPPPLRRRGRRDRDGRHRLGRRRGAPSLPRERFGFQGGRGRSSSRFGGNSPPPRERRAKQHRFFSVKNDMRPIHSDFGAAIRGVDLGAILSSPDPDALRAFGRLLRRLVDRHGLLYFPSPASEGPAGTYNDNNDNNDENSEQYPPARQLEPKQLVALHALFDHDLDAPPATYHRGMCRLWRLGVPQVNLLANKAAFTTGDEAALHALKDDGRPCASNTVYGMETYAWHADEASRPGALAVKYTAFHAAKIDNASQGETHFTSAVRAYEALDADLRRRVSRLDVRYLANPKSLDAFLPPLDVAGKHDALLEPDGTAKSDADHAGQYLDALVARCREMKTCLEHVSPLVTPHPRTGRPALHLDVKQQLGFRGLNHSDSQRLLKAIMTPAAHPDRVYRHRWRVGDVVVADNFHVLHTAAPGEAFNHAARLIERICVPGGYAPPKVIEV